MNLSALAYIGLDIVALSMLVGALYVPRHGRRDLVAAYIGVNVGVLAVTLLLSSATVAEGLGLGLFGVLSIIRLRSTALAQGEVAYFFAALALGLLGGIEAPIGAVAILMTLVLVALFVGDHPALMRRNRNQVVTFDRAISDEGELADRLENLLDAKVLTLDIQRLDLVNDTTLVDVRYRLHRPRAAEVPQQPRQSRLPASAPPSAEDPVAAPSGEHRPGTSREAATTAVIPQPPQPSRPSEQSGRTEHPGYQNPRHRQGPGHQSPPPATTQQNRPATRTQALRTESSGAPPPPSHSPQPPAESTSSTSHLQDQPQDQPRSQLQDQRSRRSSPSYRRI